MDELMAGKDATITKIIEKEWLMFAAVKAVETAACQQMPHTFYAMRKMSHSVLSEDTLQAYLQDLTEAEQVGRNLVIEKYARMDDLIPPLKYNEDLLAIVRRETVWMEALHLQYPHAVNFDENFASYESGELETYSDETLRLYRRDVDNAYANGINLVEQRYLHLYCGLGFTSLAEVEATAKQKGGSTDGEKS